MIYWGLHSLSCFREHSPCGLLGSCKVVLLRIIVRKHYDEKGLETSKVKLAAVLRKFYAEARIKNGELYTKASLVGIRFGEGNEGKLNLCVVCLCIIYSRQNKLLN